MKKYPHLVETGVKFEKYHERVYFRRNYTLKYFKKRANKKFWILI